MEKMSNSPLPPFFGFLLAPLFHLQYSRLRLCDSHARCALLCPQVGTMTGFHAHDAVAGSNDDDESSNEKVLKDRKRKGGIAQPRLIVLFNPCNPLNAPTLAVKRGRVEDKIQLCNPPNPQTKSSTRQPTTIVCLLAVKPLQTERKQTTSNTQTLCCLLSKAA